MKMNRVKKSKNGFEKRIKGFYLGLAQLRKLVPEQLSVTFGKFHLRVEQRLLVLTRAVESESIIVGNSLKIGKIGFDFFFISY